MNDFVRIASLFSSPSERNIHFLSRIYNDESKLRMTISGLVGDIFSSAEIIKNKRVLIKPNWVKHNEHPSDDVCLRTNDQFVIALLRVILPLRPAHIVLGDAPIQGCIWDKMITVEYLEQINELSEKYNVPIEVMDFRRTLFDLNQNRLSRERRSLNEYVIFDTGKESFLEPVSSSRNSFRVTNYDPDKLIESHYPGVHKYCISKEIFKCDVIISLPKVKTHQKTGITAALKNIVGLNGDKDFLPHHRIGGTGSGGDCYPGKNSLRYLSELALDHANRMKGKSSYRFWVKVSSIFWLLSFRGTMYHLDAGWYGNDTTWRMVMDLNKIILYGTPDGNLGKYPVRTFFSLCDGIIGGEGDGPLNPNPLPLGIISFTNHSGLNDLAMATLMGFNAGKIPMLNAVREGLNIEHADVIWNGIKSDMSFLKNFEIATVPPAGWIGHIK